MTASMSVVIPVYNEQAQGAAIVAAVRAALEARGGPWEIIVVDNASSDATVARIEPLLADPRIRLLRNGVNRGKGYSVRRGMLEAQGDLRLMCDADCEPSLSSLARLEAVAAAGADVVAGLRNAPESHVPRHQPLRRRAASLGFIFLCRRVMREPLRDVFCGFKLFRGAAADEVFARCHVDGWAFDAEALALARALGYRVDGAGIEWINRPDSRLSIPRVVIPVLRELVATRAHLHREAARTVASRPARADGLAAPDA